MLMKIFPILKSEVPKLENAQKEKCCLLISENIWQSQMMTSSKWRPSNIFKLNSTLPYNSINTG